MDDAEVMQTRDVETVADERGELVDRLGVARGDRERRRQRSPIA